MKTIIKISFHRFYCFPRTWCNNILLLKLNNTDDEDESEHFKNPKERKSQVTNLEKKCDSENTGEKDK